MSDDTAPTMWVQVPASWARTHGIHTFLVDNHNRTLGPVLGQTASGPYEGRGVFQVVMSDVMKPAFKAWLDARDQVLYVIPVEHDLPTFGIGKFHGGER